MNLRCLFGHDWVIGRFAKTHARKPLKGNSSPAPRNRACFRCGKKDLAATEAEKEFAAREKLRGELE